MHAYVVKTNDRLNEKSLKSERICIQISLQMHKYFFKDPILSLLHEISFELKKKGN